MADTVLGAGRGLHPLDGSGPSLNQPQNSEPAGGMEGPTFRDGAPRQKSSLSVGAFSSGTEEVCTPFCARCDLRDAHGGQRNFDFGRPDVVPSIDSRGVLET
jgi:hypothetical protein